MTDHERDWDNRHARTFGEGSVPETKVYVALEGHHVVAVRRTRMLSEVACEMAAGSNIEWFRDADQSIGVGNGRMFTVCERVMS